MEVSVQLHAPAAITLGKEPPSPVTDWIGGWLGPRAGLDVVAKKNPCRYWDLNPGPPAPSIVSTRIVLFRLPFKRRDMESFLSPHSACSLQETEYVGNQFITIRFYSGRTGFEYPVSYQLFWPRVITLFVSIRGCIQKFPDRVFNEINHSLRRKTKALRRKNSLDWLTK
jgi:hypothetical protein